MTIKNGPLSKQIVLYPLAQSSIYHDLPIWLVDEEYEVYKKTSIFNIDVVLTRGQLDEDELIDHAIQNQSPTNSPLENLVKVSESQPWIELHSVDSTYETTKDIDFGPSISLKINSKFSVEE